MKLVVEVAGARDLPARRGRGGGVSPFVQVAFGGQRHATGVRPPGEANPTWNETLVFAAVATTARGGLSDGSIDVGVYHRRASGGKSCRLFGAVVAPSAEEALLLRCPLGKPSFFAPARGEVALRLYLAPYASSSTSAAVAAANAQSGNAYSSTYATTTFNDTASMDGPETVVGGASTQSAPAMIKKQTKKKEPVQVFHSIPTQSSTGSLIFPPPPPPPLVPPTAGVPAKGADKKAVPATADDAKAAEYLMVDKLEFLYVNLDVFLCPNLRCYCVPELSHRLDQHKEDLDDA
ncbi:multiple C2 and transmembrane domain-containing protein 1-like [Panicum miliaceum]|uniref:Multiple C2 and transmembrane domain-containing protein 1-like n=1 Tax=Panicum miliaceum TaxID=4540 RepID=A0A3L6Q1F6_PANMI|nr:multiple C2 and transmembrane domain-containing protein 1-like [Panicum miliaceum]